MAKAGRFDRQAWDWPVYQPLLETALAHGLPVVAANLSRAEARRVVSGGIAALGDPALAAAVALADTPARRAALETDILEGHCGHRFPAPTLAGMVAAQQARDALMARIAARAALDAGRRGAVLITGSGHARKDRGVPAYLPPGLRAISLAFVETAGPDAGAAVPAPGAETIYDYVWPTAAAPRTDPCLAFRKPAAR
ncbi:MAG: ChaN family lipoprotein [Betaproteobacteria bacterium]|nr:ChaN family lipoprotein [Betaproteobacteria bacterium]